jgi:hypothetical protein
LSTIFQLSASRTSTVRRAAVNELRVHEFDDDSETETVQDDYGNDSDWVDLEDSGHMGYGEANNGNTDTTIMPSRNNTLFVARQDMMRASVFDPFLSQSQTSTR